MKTEEQEIKEMERLMKKNHDSQRALFVEKQKAYSTRAIKEFGLDGIIIRLSDKMLRLKNLAYHKDNITMSAPCNESIDDTLMDIANYANIALVIREMNKNAR
jgi:hypothetical protein